MAVASTSVHVVEQGPQNDCCQRLYSQSKLHLPSASPEDSPDQQVGLIQTPLKLLPLPWLLKCSRFCKHPLRVKSPFPTAPWDSPK